MMKTTMVMAAFSSAIPRLRGRHGRVPPGNGDVTKSGNWNCYDASGNLKSVDVVDGNLVLTAKPKA